MSMREALLKKEDYSRIHNITVSLLNAENADLDKSCFFYSLVGASILRHHFSIDAKVLAGAALYCLDAPSNTVLTFAEIIEDEIFSSKSRFHSWIEVNGSIVDFMAPRFPSILSSLGNSIPIPRRIFLKDKIKMSRSIADLKISGDFIVKENLELTNMMHELYSSKQAYRDLLEIAAKWFAPFPNAIIRTVGISDQNSNVKQLKFNDEFYSEYW